MCQLYIESATTLSDLSKWGEAIPTSSCTSQVVEELKFLCSQFGLLESILSDNGTGFTSAKCS